MAKGNRKARTFELTIPVDYVEFGPVHNKNRLHRPIRNVFCNSDFPPGSKYYEYDATGILFPWAPLSLRDLGLPKNAEAGYSIQENGYIIRSGKIWLMNEVSRTVHPDSPKSIRRLWGVNSINNMDSAFILGGKFIYAIFSFIIFVLQ